MSDCDDCDGDVEIVHGDKDKYGIGQAVSSICGLLFIIVIALACSGNLYNVILALIG